MTFWNIGRGPAQQRVHQYQWKLDQRSSITFDSNGNGQILFSPGGARERWVINFVAISTTGIPVGNYTVPQMIMYRESPVPGNQLGGTFNALMDADSGSQYILNMSEPVYCVFSNGYPGAVATVHIEGIRYVWE